MFGYRVCVDGVAELLERSGFGVSGSQSLGERFHWRQGGKVVCLGQLTFASIRRELVGELPVFIYCLDSIWGVRSAVADVVKGCVGAEARAVNER